jgi:hypothetical protein
MTHDADATRSFPLSADNLAKDFFALVVFARAARRWAEPVDAAAQRARAAQRAEIIVAAPVDMTRS